jgi:plasmid maintenance system antidote protein VapI
MNMNTNRKPRHLGALIKRQYLEPLNMTVTELANILGVSRKDNIEPPLLTCEAVISEACFLLRNVYGGQDAVINLVRNGVIKVP